MVLIIDNYDSFTYNLYQYIGCINPDVKVLRNDEVTIEEIKRLNPSHIVISPGPGFPVKAGISISVIKKFYQSVPILGICLGHQAIGEAFGGQIVHANTLYHGKATEILVEQDAALFAGIPHKIQGARYHSLVIRQGSLPPDIKIIAKTEGEEIMGIRHCDFPVFGVQFHPESILTKQGMHIIKNFLKLKKEDVKCEKSLIS